MMLPMMLPCCDFMMARQRALEASVSIATAKMFPEPRCKRLPLRTAIANVPDSKPTVPARMWTIKSGSRMLPRPFSTCDREFAPWTDYTRFATTELLGWRPRQCQHQLFVRYCCRKLQEHDHFHRIFP